MARSRKRLVYVAASLVAVAIFVPTYSQAWGIYVAVCAGYTVLVFGLRQLSKGARASSNAAGELTVGTLRTHLTFLAIVVGWVWLLMFLRPHLPYFLRTEDTSRPYFGLVFLGILGLLFIEYLEQRWLRPDPEVGAINSDQNGSPRSLTGSK
jgi:hypothetical protein